MADASPNVLPQPIRIIEHNLLDICDQLGATLALDGDQVSFVIRSAAGRRELQGALGDWLVAESATLWRIVPDAEFGRLRAAARADSEPNPPRVATTS